jgi:periplasmic divalent cation tolerance protein
MAEPPDISGTDSSYYIGLQVNEIGRRLWMGVESEFVIAMTTLGREADAVQLARILLERELVACVSIVPSVRSLYRWKGAIEDGEEFLLIMKTRGALFERLERSVDELHPYEVPELLCLPVSGGHEPYLKWLTESVSD